MAECNGGDAVVAAFAASGVKHVFGVVSIHNLPIYDALLRDGTIDVINVRHEQAAVHAAEGYARATGKVGIAIASTGPGAANAVPGLYEASVSSSRVLMITGQVDSRDYGLDKGCFHEADRQLGMLGSVTRSALSVSKAADIIPAILRGFSDVCNGRPQPAAIEITIDAQHAPISISVPEPVPAIPAPVDEAALKPACEALAGSHRPLIWAGGGVMTASASRELTMLAEKLSAPVLTTIQGRGAIPEDHPLSLGANPESPRVQALLRESDLLLAVGTRFEEDETKGWSLELPERMIHVDIDAKGIGRNYKPEFALVGDAKACLLSILSRVLETNPDGNWTLRAAKVRKEIETESRHLIGPDHASIMDSIRRLLPRDGIVVRDRTIPSYTWGDRLLPVYEPDTSIWPTSGAIGPGLPMAIGAAIGTGKRVLLMQGDGGFMLNIGELSTAAQYKAPIAICLFNDGGYGVLRELQRNRYGRQIGVDLPGPDFPALARAFGIACGSAASPGEFRSHLEMALRTDGPYLIDIDMHSLKPITINADWAKSGE